jgi:hypothetical protein
MQGVMSVVGACTFGGVETKSSGTSTRAAKFYGQRNTLCLLNLWQNFSRVMRLSCEPSGAGESPTDPAARLWWGLCVTRSQMFRMSAFYVGSYGVDSVLQYSERFWSNFANNWCGGDDVDRCLRHSAISTCCTTIMRATLQQSAVYFYWLWQVYCSVGLHWYLDLGSFSSNFICWLWRERHMCMLVRSCRTGLRRGITQRKVSYMLYKRLSLVQSNCEL